MAASTVFVVRIWPSGALDEGFRALVRRVDGDQELSFSEPGELIRYLTRDPAGAPGGPAAMQGSAAAARDGAHGHEP